jgi:hypothetical protein
VLWVALEEMAVLVVLVVTAQLEVLLTQDPPGDWEESLVLVVKQMQVD